MSELIQRSRGASADALARLLAAGSDARVILDHVADPVVIHDADGHLVFANAPAAELMGVQAGPIHVPGDTVAARFQTFDADGRPLERPDFPSMRALAGEQAPEALIRYRDVEGGSDRWSLSRSRAVRGPGGEVVMVVSVLHDVTEAKAAEAALSFLNKASEILSSSLDLDGTMQRVATIAVPEIADYCAVSLLDEQRRVRRTGVAHADASKAELLEEIERRYPPPRSGDHPILHVLRTEEPLLLPDVTDETLQRAARDDEHLRMLRMLGLRSAIAVPLVARGQCFGVISLSMAESGRRYGPQHMPLALELARRAAIAVDNARLYRNATDAADQLHSSFALLDTLLRSAPVGLAFVDPDLRNIRVNDFLAAVNGVPVADHIGRTIAEIRPDIAADIEPVAAHVIETGEPVLDMPLRSRRGEEPTRHSLVSFYPVRAPGGAIIGAGIVVNDITRLRESEQALATANRRLEALFDAAPLAVVALDARGDVELWSPGAERLFGWNPDEVLGRPLPFSLGPGHGREATVLGKDGKPIEVAAWSADISDEAGIATGRVWVFADATDRRAAERERDLLLERERTAREAAEATAAQIRNLQSVTDAALAHLALDDLLDELLRRIREILAADTLLVLLPDEDGGMRPRAILGVDTPPESYQAPARWGIAKRIAESRAPLIVDDVAAASGVHSFLVERGIASLVGVPLIVHGRVVGVLQVGSTTPRRFNEDDVRLLQLVGDRVGSAIDNANLFEEEQRARIRAERAAGRLARMQTVTAALAGAATTADVASIVLDQGLGALGADKGSLVLREGNELVVHGATGYDRPLLERWSRFGIDARAPLADAVRTGELVIVGTPEERDRRYPDLGPGQLSPTTASIPLVGAHGVIGAMGLSFSSQRAIDEEDASFMWALAQQCAHAIERAHLYESEREARRSSEAARDRLALLAESSRVMSTSLDTATILDRLAGLVAGTVAGWCLVHAIDDRGGLNLVAARASGDEALPGSLRSALRLDPDAAGGIPQVAADGSARMGAGAAALAEGARDPQEAAAALEAMGTDGWICVPLERRGRILGTITFGSGPERPYCEEDVELARELAERAALFVDNARLFQERAHVARTLQESLLPPELPDIPGLEVAAAYRAAGDQTEVGGDFYDVFATGDDGWALVIGDVCGKGAEAAAITASARYTLRAASIQERSPVNILRTLNEALRRQGTNGRFCTVAYVRLRRTDAGARVTVTTGGHPLPLVLHADGEVRPIGRAGTLIGLFADVELEEDSIELKPGESLLMYTDGVTDARGPSATFGEGMLRYLLGSCAGMTAPEIAQHIGRTVIDYQNGTPRDDVAIVVLRVPA